MDITSKIDTSSLYDLYLKYAFEPKHPDTIVIKPNEFYPKGISEQYIWEYYNSIKTKIISILKNYKIMLRIAISPNKTIVKRKDKDKEIFIRTVKDFEKYNNGRNIEFHIVLSKQSNTGWVDLDPGKLVPFSTIKNVSKDIYNLIKKALSIHQIQIKYTGGRGFHIWFILNQKRDVDSIREDLKEILQDYIDENENDNLTLSTKKNENQIRLDVSTLHEAGSIRAPFSLNAQTGLASIPVSDKKISDFKKKDATINLTKKMAQNFFWINKYGKKIFEGKYVIHEHKAKKAGMHFDLRIEVPMEWSNGIKQYFKKRKKKETPEPFFNKEDKTVLLSFAIPKHRFPKNNKKYLAIQTEAHPVKYLNFSGTIPEGEYGAGTMKIKDKGNIFILDFSKNKIEFELDGKYKGHYYLTHRNNDQWFLGQYVSHSKKSSFQKKAQVSSLQNWDFSYRDTLPGDTGDFFDPTIDVEYGKPFRRIVIVPSLENRQIITLPVVET